MSNINREWENIVNGIVDWISDSDDNDFVAVLAAVNEQPNKISDNIGSIFERSLKDVKRRRLEEAKKRVLHRKSSATNKLYNLPVTFQEQLRLLKKAISRKPELQLAYRNYSEMSPEDVKLALRQLIDLGEIDDDGEQL